MSSSQWNEERLRMFGEGVRLCFTRWTALQLAVDNQWGGRHSSQKAQQLIQDVVDFITQSKEIRYIDELEELLDESLLESFNTELDDGSIEEVAETVMHLNEECSVGNFERVQKLSIPVAAAGAPKSVCEKQEEESDEDAGDDDPEQSEAMNVDSTSENRAAAASNTNNNQTLSATEIADGWQVVQPRGGRGRRQQS